MSEIPLNQMNYIPVTRLDDIPITILDEIQMEMGSEALVNRVVVLESVERNIPNIISSSYRH